MCKQVITAGSSNMLSIFAGGNILHPYRLQPHVRINVPFSSYQTFVKSMCSIEADWLKYPKNNYRSAVRNQTDDVLIRYYYHDMADSVLNEIRMSIQYQELPTMIIHSLDTRKCMFIELDMISTVIKELKSLVDVMGYARNLRNSLGFEVNLDSLPDETKLLWWYAVALHSAAWVEKKPYGFNII